MNGTTHASRREAEEQAAAALSLLSLVSPHPSTSNSGGAASESANWMRHGEQLEQVYRVHEDSREDENSISRSLSRKGKEKATEISQGPPEPRTLSPIATTPNSSTMPPALSPISIPTLHTTPATNPYLLNGRPMSPAAPRKRKELHTTDTNDPFPLPSSPVILKKKEKEPEARTNGHALPGTIGYGHGKAGASQTAKRRSILNGNGPAEKMSGVKASNTTTDGGPKKRRRTSPLAEMHKPSVPSTSGNNNEISCICQLAYDDGSSLGCEDCSRWVHAACFGIVLGTESEPGEWRCWECSVPPWTPQQVVLGRERGIEIQKARLQPAAEAAKDDPVDIMQEDSDHEDEIPHLETRDRLKSVGAGWRGLSALSRSHMDPFVPLASVPVPVYMSPSPPPLPPRTRRTRLPYEAYPPPHSLRGLGNDPRVLPPSYALHTTSPIPAKDYITPFRSVITPSNFYLANALNQYEAFGMPKPGVHLFGEPLDVALDARGPAFRLRSGCMPNAVLRPVVREHHEGVEFGVFALRDLRAGEEVVVGWEWDDEHVVRHISDEMKPQLHKVLHSLGSVFTTCACGEDSRCTLRCIENCVEGRSYHVPALGEPRGFKVTTTGFGTCKQEQKDVPSTLGVDFRPPDPPMSPQSEANILPSRMRRKTVATEHSVAPVVHTPAAVTSVQDHAMDVDVDVDGPWTPQVLRDDSPHQAQDEAANGIRDKSHSPPSTASDQSGDLEDLHEHPPDTPPSPDLTSVMTMLDAKDPPVLSDNIGAVTDVNEHDVDSVASTPTPVIELNHHRLTTPLRTPSPINGEEPEVATKEEVDVDKPLMDGDLDSTSSEFRDLVSEPQPDQVEPEPDREPEPEPEPEKPKVKLSLKDFAARRKSIRQKEQPVDVWTRPSSSPEQPSPEPEGQGDDASTMEEGEVDEVVPTKSKVPAWPSRPSYSPEAATQEPEAITRVLDVPDSLLDIRKLIESVSSPTMSSFPSLSFPAPTPSTSIPPLNPSTPTISAVPRPSPSLPYLTNIGPGLNAGMRPGPNGHSNSSFVANGRSPSAAFYPIPTTNVAPAGPTLQPGFGAKKPPSAPRAIRERQAQAQNLNHQQGSYAQGQYGNGLRQPYRGRMRGGYAGANGRDTRDGERDWDWDRDNRERERGRWT